MNKYVYTNRKTGEVDVWFADSLMAADKLYECEYGTHPSKLAYVSCEITFGAKNDHF